MSQADHEHLRRREFFRNAVGRTIRPLADYLEERMGKAPAEWGRLRPPGAIGEDRFNDTCLRCGNCVTICPATAIFSLGDDAGKAAGTPVIDPDQAACVVCDGLKCTHVCPSGALQPLFHASDIDMGVAEVYPSLCVRSSGEACRLCVDLCPLGASAIRFVDDGPPEVLAAGCVGCGVCQLYCPTSPKAIVVKAR